MSGDQTPSASVAGTSLSSYNGYQKVQHSNNRNNYNVFQAQIKRSNKKVLILGEHEKKLILCLSFVCGSFFLCHRMIRWFPQLMSSASGLPILSRVSKSPWQKSVFLCIYNKYQDQIVYVSLLNIGFATTIKLSTFVLSTHLPYIFPSSDKIIFRLPHGG